MTHEGRRLTGRIETFDVVQRWGRVASDGALYVFAASDIAEGATLKPGASVEFTPIHGVRGRFAREVRRLA
jgi:hypothetical protein